MPEETKKSAHAPESKTIDVRTLEAQHPIKVAILWHQHQPFYALGNTFAMPWVWLHSTKDYWEMARHLELQPGMKATINLVPSLVKQIELYLSGEAKDTLLDIMNSRTEALSDAKKQYILDTFFNVNHDRAILRSKRYTELHQKSQHDRETFSEQEYRDLIVHFALGWTAEFARRQELVAGLVKKDREYTEEDREALTAELGRIVAATLPLHKKLSDSGQVELSASPYYHPIMPLLCDTDSAKESMPHVLLPQHRFRHPDDAADQLRRAIDAHESHFGKKPNGIWPSEGSLSEAVLRIMTEQGIAWTASDEQVLYNSITKEPSGPQSSKTFGKYFPRKYTHKGKEIMLFFRDHALSDNIGFLYQSWKPEDAASDLVSRLREIRHGLVSSFGEQVLDDACVSIILDGENCWEYYPDNGIDFLQALYSNISKAVDILPVTFSEASQKLSAKAKELDSLQAGSWINGNFGIWIGHPEDDASWDLLSAAREKFESVRKRAEGLQGKAKERMEERIKLAQEELLIAEGSDWNWWYGDDHFSIQKDKFDELYRAHLRAMYVHLDERVPDGLMHAIQSRKDLKQIYQRVANQRGKSPAIHGLLSESHWEGTQSVNIRSAYGAMHRAETFSIERFELAREAGLTYFLLQLSPLPKNERFRFHLKDLVLELSAKHLSVTSEQSHSWDVRGVVNETVEFALPSTLLRGDTTIAFEVLYGLNDSSESVIRFPPDGTFEFPAE